MTTNVMAKRRTIFKTNVDQPIVIRKSSRVKSNKDYMADESKSIRASVFNEPEERAKRLKWILKWIVALPVGTYLLLWFLLSMFDLFMN